MLIKADGIYGSGNHPLPPPAGDKQMQAEGLNREKIKKYFNLNPQKKI
jgi:hypothetical protein